MRPQSLAVVTFFLCGTAMAGVFRKTEDFHGIQDFGAIHLVEGHWLIGREGRSTCVPVATQFRVDQGPYLTYDPDGKSSAVQGAMETNLKAPWKFVIEKTGRLPYGSGSYGKRYTQTTEIRVQATTGPFKDWYIGIDRAALKAALEESLRKPTTKEGSPPKLWPLILVKDPADALIFIHRVSGVYDSK